MKPGRAAEPAPAGLRPRAASRRAKPPPRGNFRRAGFVPATARVTMMKLRLLAPLALSLLHAAAAECCTIPVFRYALDRWEPDKLPLILPPSASQDVALTDLLRPLRANGKANLDIKTSKDAALEKSELHFANHGEGLTWSGELNAAALAALLDSPAREKIIRCILSGDSIVWVIVRGDNDEDKAHAGRIAKRLNFLEQVAALPVQDANDPDSQLGKGPPLKLKFTTLELRRDDPAEQLLVKMLAGPRDEIDPAHTSFAAAVFGRGRVLSSWKLAELDDAALEDASMFLTGRCSYRIKDNNPGWDLLLNVDWPAALEKASAGDLGAFAVAEVNAAVASAAPSSTDNVTKEPAPATAIRLSALSTLKPESVTVEPAKADAAPAGKSASMSRLVQAAAVGSVLIAAGLFFLFKKPRP